MLLLLSAVTREITAQEALLSGSFSSHNKKKHAETWVKVMKGASLLYLTRWIYLYQGKVVCVELFVLRFLPSVYVLEEEFNSSAAGVLTNPGAGL